MPRRALRVFIAAATLLLSASALGQKEQAPEIRKSDVWINSAPLTLKALKGKVVLVDFWAFECEPCIEALPHVLSLYQKYAKDGLVIIGVHAPRTDNERDVRQLRAAVTRMGIPFPVVVDNAQKIWADYRCDIWPTQFVIDRNGTIQLVHGGVGRYAEVDAKIRSLLAGR